MWPRSWPLVCPAESRTAAAALAAHRAQRQSSYELLLHQQTDDEYRKRSDYRERRGLSPHRALAAEVSGDGDRQRVGVVARHQQREEELGPAEDERERAGRHQPGQRERQGDAAESLDWRAAVDQRALFDLDGDVGEIAAHHPDRER